MVSTGMVVASTMGVLMTGDVVRAVLQTSEYAKERVLWLSVLRQAIMDSEGRGEIEQPLIYRAKKWLTRLTYSFLTVCSLAGMSREQAVYLQEAQRRKLA
jgi:hypothetical protein